MVMIDREVARKRVEQWLAKQLPDVHDVQVSPFRIPYGTGNSAETFFLDVKYLEKGKPCERKLVLRRQVKGYDLFLNADLDLPYHMMAALAAHSDVPVPNLIAIEYDSDILGSPFLVMDAVSGRVVEQVPNYNLEGWVADLPPQERKKLWFSAIKAIANLHRVNWKDGFEFLDDPARGAPGLDQYLDWVKEWYLWARADRPQPVADIALDYLFDNKPEATKVCVLWGDATPANTLFAPDHSVAALVDFEMAALGPPEVDLAWWLFFDDFYSTAFGVERLEGLPTKSETIEYYESVSGHSVTNIDYYLLLARFRMNIVGIRWVDRLISMGRLSPNNDAQTHNVITRMMAAQLNLPLPELGAGFKEMVEASVKRG